LVEKSIPRFRREHAALYRLLASMIDPYISATKDTETEVMTTARGSRLAT
jgi:hypothetical protein